MTGYSATQYINEFADLCEKLHFDELEYALPRMLDIAPYVLEEEFGENWFIVKQDVQKLLQMKAFDSAISAIIPCGMQVIFTKNDQYEFSFCSETDDSFSQSYKSSNGIFSIGLLSSYLRYILNIHKSRQRIRI